MTVVVPTTADVLRGIAEEVRRDPDIWTQYALGRDEWGLLLNDPSVLGSATCACSVGLLYLAFGDVGPSCLYLGRQGVDAQRALEETLEADGYVGDFETSHAPSLADWNDDEGRTAEEVADLFDRTAARLEAGVA